MRSWIKSVLIAAALLPIAMLPGRTSADALPQPSGRVILTVSGAINRTNQNGVAQFDADMLSRIGRSTVSTSTTWTDGIPSFSGVLGRDLMKPSAPTGARFTR